MSNIVESLYRISDINNAGNKSVNRKTEKKLNEGYMADLKNQAIDLMADFIGDYYEIWSDYGFSSIEELKENILASTGDLYGDLGDSAEIVEVAINNFGLEKIVDAAIKKLSKENFFKKGFNESINRKNKKKLNESIADKQDAIVSKLEDIINRYDNTLDTSVSGNTITIGQAGGKTVSYTIDAKTVYKLTLVSSESGEQLTNLEVVNNDSFVKDCAVKILPEVYDVLNESINKKSSKKLNEDINTTILTSSNGTFSLNIEDGEYYIDSASFSRIKIDLFSKRENGIKYLYPKLSFSSDGNITAEEASEFSLLLIEAIDFANDVENYLSKN